MSNEESHYLVPSNIPIDHRRSNGHRFGKLIKLQLVKYTRSRKLACGNGLMLQITPSGRICGTDDTHNPLVNLQVISVGANMIAFWGKESEKYLAVNSKGEIYASQEEGRDCVFIENFTDTFFNTYETYHTFNQPTRKFLTVNNNGRAVMSENLTKNSMFYWEIPESKLDENNNEAIYVNI